MSLNTISINDRLGPGGLENVAILSTDVNNNTVLVGADGETFSISEGQNIVTVGAGGQYATIAEAVAYINTQTILTTVLTTTCNLTGNDLHDLTLGDVVPYDATTKNKELFLKLGTNPFLYPVESSAGAATAVIRVKYPISGLATGVQAAVLYVPTKWVIKLLCGEHAIAVGTEETLPAFVEIHGAGMGASVITGAAAANIGILNGLTTNGRNVLKDLTISINGANGSCFSVENTNATVCTTGYEIKTHRVEYLVGGTAIDGLHIKSSQANTTDYVEVVDCEATGIYDTVAILSARRAKVIGCKLRSSQNDTNPRTLPVGLNIGASQIYPSFFDIQSNVLEAINTGTGIGKSAKSLQISANTIVADAHVVANISGNRFIARTTAASTYSSTNGIVTQQGDGDPAHVILSRNNIFDCAGSPTASVDIFSNEGTVRSAGDRKITGAAINSEVAAPGVVTIEL